MKWFLFEGRAHALASVKHVSHTGRCGIIVNGDVPTRDVPADELYPPEACATCMIRVGLDDVEDEPLEVAVGRGYVPAPLED